MSEWQRIIDGQQQTIDQLKRRINVLEKEQQCETTKLRLEVCSLRLCHN